MRLAHVRRRTAPAGAAWRLAAALDPGEAPQRWLDLELARQRSLAADPRGGRNRVLHRRRITTLDAHLASGLRVEALRELIEGFEPRGRPPTVDGGGHTDRDEAILLARDLQYGPPILRPPALRDFYAFEGHVRTMWERRGGEVPAPWYRLPIFYFSNVSEIRGPDDPVWAPRGSVELDYELEVAAIIDSPVRDLAPERADGAIGGYTIFNDWSARDLQREESVVRLGPAKGKDFASSFGPWLVTPEELREARTETGYELPMTAEVNGMETSRGRWSEARFGFAEMLARASADASIRAGEILGSGTVGTGCLLEVRDDRFGRYLEPGDEVVLRVERLGALRTPIIDRPSPAT